MAISFSVYHIYVVLLLFLLAIICNGLTIRLIHRDSIDSPLYPGNLTVEERLERINIQSDSRVRYLEASTSKSTLWNHTSHEQPNVIGTQISFQDNLYLAKIGIGTLDNPPPQPNYQNNFLIVDTGSDLIWTQCELCTQCFPQAQPLFPYTRSSTFKNLPCGKHPMCYPNKCNAGLCLYDQKYASNQLSVGYLGIDRFTFESENGDVESVDDIGFGCGGIQRGFNFATNPNQINGIVGFGTGPRSLLNQLGDKAKGRFSYCIPRWKNSHANNIFIRFGDDAKFSEGQQVVTTPLVEGSLPTYYVSLLDISVDGRKLGFPYELLNDKGCVLDNGSPITNLPRNAYNVVREAVVSFYEQFNLPIIQKPNQDLCYQTQGSSQHFPKITFHILNADLVVDIGSFLYLGDSICFAMKPHDYNFVSVIIGGFAQSDYRFVYDLPTGSVSFAKENC